MGSILRKMKKKKPPAPPNPFHLNLGSLLHRFSKAQPRRATLLGRVLC